MSTPSAARPLSASRLRLRVTAAAESALRAGHPWLFSDSIREQNRPGQLGELAVIYDRRDTFLAIGMFDPESPLRVRVLHRGKPCQLTPEWWRNRLTKALNLRTDVSNAQTTGYRCIYGESDGFPGLVLDRYDRTFVLKLYTAAWLPRLAELNALFQDSLGPERLVLRLSRNIQRLAESQFHRRDGDVLIGSTPEAPVLFLETGLTFEADVLRGQKTGFFLDQRENRRRLEKVASGRRCLNLFSFSGAFSVYAARGGARSVTDLDMSPHALSAAARNFSLNSAVREVRACPRESIQADAFAWIREAPVGQYDLVVVDPPSLARRASERTGALLAYRRLLEGAIRIVASNGILVAASCSAHVSAEDFFQLVLDAGQRSGRGGVELIRTLHPSDHPACFAEAQYLKCLFLRIPDGCDA